MQNYLFRGTLKAHIQSAFEIWIIAFGGGELFTCTTASFIGYDSGTWQFNFFSSYLPLWMYHTWVTETGVPELDDFPPETKPISLAIWGIAQSPQQLEFSHGFGREVRPVI
ncbi:hypothetical protein TESG_07384 [Trichophyton tonsurans CBS 112818]|uniref:Uncharacterized protein n=1 Tax=Trichophyton tonsurans (strain CBS 112818) TaxID=647933 RepID=F2S911_TRIT1|nr:hypothetical protein TESG_07384 [Trichophyton tonsurans CBS 112818]